MHILVIDDDATITFLLTLALRDAGYTVVCVANGELALERLRASTERPCLILLDLMMPHLNGWEFRVQQLADPALASIPVAIFTAARPTDAKVHALQAVAVLRKPMDFGSILAVVAQYCGTVAGALPDNEER